MRTINSLDQLPLIMTAKDVQDCLQVSKSRAYEIFKEVDFPAKVIGGNKRVYRDEFLKWLETKGSKN